MRIKVYDPVEETICCPVTKQPLYNEDGVLQKTAAMVCCIAWEVLNSPTFYDRGFEKLYNDTQKRLCEIERKRNPDDEEPYVDLHTVLKTLPSRYICFELHEYGMACGPVEGVFFCIFDTEAKSHAIQKAQPPRTQREIPKRASGRKAAAQK